MDSLPVARRPRLVVVVSALALVVALAAAWPAAAAIPAVVTEFQGQGLSMGGPCLAGSTCALPADPVGAASSSYYVQTTNINGSAGLAVWSKSGTLLTGPKHLNSLWSGYVGTNAGNGCASRNDGDGIVRYDQLAD